MRFIAIDLGTSFIKGALLDPETCEISHVQRIPFPDPIPGLDAQRCEFDPADVLAKVGDLIFDLGNTARRCEGIVMCTQMASMVLIDRHHTALTNCIGWRDKRAMMSHPSGAGTYHEVLKQRLTASQRRELGNELPVGCPASFLFWFAEHRLLEAGSIPVSLADFVLCKLCNSAATVEATNAMAYGLLDVQRRQWHDEVIEQLGLGIIRWPSIVEYEVPIGHIRIGGRDVPCYSPIGDYQCALAGAMLGEKELSLNISTGSQVSRITSNFTPGNYQSRPFFDGKYTNTLSHLPAGRALNVLVDLLTEIERGTGNIVADPWPYITEAVDATECTDIGAELSFFSGPCGERGSITNISETNLSVGALFRAAFKNMAENYYTCAHRIWPERTWHRIVFSGGVSQKLPTLRKVILDRFKSDFRLCAVSEDTLLGLLIVARVCGGVNGSVLQATHEVQSQCGYDRIGENPER